MRVAIFGGTGFLGTALANAIHARGGEVLRFARRPAETPHGAMIECDATRAVEALALRDVDLIVNLIGIKKPDLSTAGRQGFEEAHVHAVKNIVAAAREAGVSRIVHISVARGASTDAAEDDARSAYLMSKARGEEIIRESELDWTILRPGIIWGEGDDFLSNLTAGIRFGPVFPLPRADGEIQPVHVDDVAGSIIACLQDDATFSKTLDLVGPERLPVSTCIERIAAVLGLTTVVWRLPPVLMALLARISEMLLRAPPITRSQLDLLRRGVIGRADVIENILGRKPRAFSVEALTMLEARGRFPSHSMFGFSLRAVRNRRSLGPIGQLSHRSHHLRWFAPLTIGVMLAMSLIAESQPVLIRVLVAHAILLGPAMWLLRGSLGYLWRPSGRRILWSLAGLAIMYAGGWMVVHGLQLMAPETIGAQLQQIYGFADGPSILMTAIPLALGICAEEMIFRGTLMTPLLAMNRPATAIAVSATAFGLSHLLLGPPLLALAAFLAGLCWAWLAARTRSLFAPCVCHLGWDALVLWGLPY